MGKIEFSTLDKEMASFDLNEFSALAEEAKVNIANAISAADVKSEICRIWSKVRKFIVWAQHIPGAGTIVKVFINLLDSLCGID